TKKLNFHLEQVQDFTPTPMTLATEIYYTGFHPYTGEKVFTAKSEKEKLAQREFFFWYKPENRQSIIGELRKMGRKDLIAALYDNPPRTHGLPPKADKHRPYQAAFTEERKSRNQKNVYKRKRK
ncbi:MAG: DUF3362 domain-containing protein, partial [Muribaculaceae bacterium]|nr:DUF3362 domain-containing protein [Muribaculaceae bacterium]